MWGKRNNGGAFGKDVPLSCVLGSPRNEAHLEQKMRATRSRQPASTSHSHAIISWRSVVCSIGLAFVVIFAEATPVRAASSAETVVQSSIDRSYAILNAQAANELQRQDQFRTLLLGMVDIQRVALFTLGPYARRASAADVSNFVGAFTGYLAAVYRRGLDTYKSQSLTVVGSTERSPDDVIVNVRPGVQTQASSQPQLAFRVRRSASGENAITDLQVEGVWLALMQREEFTAYLQQHRGDLAGLAAEVEKRTEQIRFDMANKGTAS